MYLNWPQFGKELSCKLKVSWAGNTLWNRNTNGKEWSNFFYIFWFSLIYIYFILVLLFLNQLNSFSIGYTMDTTNIIALSLYSAYQIECICIWIGHSLARNWAANWRWNKPEIPYKTYLLNMLNERKPVVYKTWLSLIYIRIY